MTRGMHCPLLRSPGSTCRSTVNMTMVDVNYSNVASSEVCAL